MTGELFRTVAPVAVALLVAAALPAGAQTQLEGGCIAQGQGPTVGLPECTYIALDDTQSVFALTPNNWEISVIRQCPRYPLICKMAQALNACPAPIDPEAAECSPIVDSEGAVQTGPMQVFLLKGGGIGGWTVPQTVHPEPGEEVFVKIEVPAVGSHGFVAVGFDEDLQDDPPYDQLPGGDDLPNVVLEN